VRYVLEGSVLRSGNQIRVNAQLIDAETDAHLWAERFEREMGDLFALQTEITRRIAWELHLELLDTEASRPTPHPDAREYILRGHAAYAKPPTRENCCARGWSAVPPPFKLITHGSDNWCLTAVPSSPWR
jgi:adenylate cyclase